MANKKTEEIVITAVRNNRKSISIAWAQGPDDYAVNFHENPLPSFSKALKALVASVCSLCEFPEKDAAKIEATGITVRAHGDNNLALIVARKKIKKAGRVFNIATPLLAMYPDPENKSADCMAEAEAAAIEKVIAEAKRYVQGERAQGLIAFEEEKPKGEKDPGQPEFPAMAEPERK
jgi:acetaldehyde dehydrogenase (acetylating)